MLVKEVAVVYSAMVGCEEEQVVSTSHLIVERAQEFSEVFVELQINLQILCSPCAVGMSDGISG